MSARPHPRESLERCALRAQLRGDPMLGTAFPASRVLLVEQPGPWGRPGLAESRFDPTIARNLERRANTAGLRLLTIRRPGRTPRGADRRWAIVDARPGGEQIRAGRYHDDKELLDIPLDGTAGEPVAGPIFLVCAHSKHDPCCALRGRGVAAALAAERRGRVFESSHLGGDRFAANVLVLPDGWLYGRVLPFAAPEFVEAAERSEVVSALLRGRIGLAPAAQAALAFAFDHLAVRRADALRVVSQGAVVAGETITRIAGPHGLIDVTVRIEKRPAVGLTCANPGPNAFLSYRPVAAKEVE